MRINPRLLILVTLLLLTLPLARSAIPAHAAPVFVVNSTSDDPDAVINGVCETTFPGRCTLRAAMMEVDASPTGGTINFNIPSCNNSSSVMTSTRLLHMTNLPLPSSALFPAQSSAALIRSIRSCV
jgi:hypothetical protein